MDLILRKVSKNTHGRDYVVGDLHGCYDLLMTELTNICFDFEKDRLFSVGDCCDRGEKNLECLELVYEPWFYAVRGNHEEMMFDAIISGDQHMGDVWMANGGAWAVIEQMSSTHEAESFKVLVEDISKRMPLAIEVETDNGMVGIVHADAPLMWTRDELISKRMGCLWGRSRAEKGKEVLVRGIDHVYSGHTPMTICPVTYGNITYMDTGCVFTKRLVIKQI